jgi:hypothetical protein
LRGVPSIGSISVFRLTLLKYSHPILGITSGQFKNQGRKGIWPIN